MTEAKRLAVDVKHSAISYMMISSRELVSADAEIEGPLA